MPLINPPQTPLSVTNKGDLQTFSTVPARLATGNDGQILESRASETTGLKWVTPNGVSADGWLSANETWTYASASTITVPSGAAAKYAVGDRIKWTQTSVRYGVITAVADTVLTIAVNTNYVVADATISANYYSHQANPIGYPTWFDYTPVFTGFSSDPTGIVARFSVIGNTVYLVHREATGGTSNNAGFTVTIPITAKTGTNYVWRVAGHGLDNGGVSTTPLLITLASAGTSVTIYKDFGQTGFTASGSKSCNFQMLYEI